MLPAPHASGYVGYTTTGELGSGVLSAGVWPGSSRFDALGRSGLDPLKPRRYVARSPGTVNIEPAMVANGELLPLLYRMFRTPIEPLTA